MAELIYVLCAATSIACAVLLFRGYRQSRSALLLWSSLCFVGLALNNVLLLVDRVVLPAEPDHTIMRSSFALIALMLLLVGLVQESK